MSCTVVAVFDQYSHALAAKTDLTQLGVADKDFSISGHQSSQGTTEAARDAADDRSVGERVADFFKSLFGSEDSEGHADRYSEAVKRGGYVLTVYVDDSHEWGEIISDTLDRHGAIDIEEREQQWRAQGWAGRGTQSVDQTGNAERAEASKEQRGEQVIPVIDEELQVGKREVERGGARVFTHTTERPVEQDVTLREERTVVERRPVDRPATSAELEGAQQDNTVEVRETVEEPVVSKTPKVVEEVTLGKEVKHRTQTVKDSVKRTDVEVQKDSDEGSSREPATER